MKYLTTLVLCFSTFAAVQVQGQGTEVMSAGSTRRVYYSTDGGSTVISVPTGNPASVPGYGQVNLALYAASAGTVLSTLPSGAPDLSSWYLGSPIGHTILPLPGTVPAFLVTLDAATGAPGANVQLEVVGWTGSYATFQDALASGSSLVGWTGSSFNGGGFGWEQQSGIALAPVVVNSGSNGYNYMVLSSVAGQFLPLVPEPGTCVLGALGAVGLLLARRRSMGAV